MHTIAVKIPFPCFEISALFPKPPGQHRVPRNLRGFCSCPPAFGASVRHILCRGRLLSVYFLDFSGATHLQSTPLTVFDETNRAVLHQRHRATDHRAILTLSVPLPSSPNPVLCAGLPLHLSQKSLFLCCFQFLCSCSLHLQSQRALLSAKRRGHCERLQQSAPITIFCEKDFLRFF